MLGIGFTEVLAIAVIALIFIGPDDLPKFARNIGRFLNELKRGSDRFVDDFKSATDMKDLNRLKSDMTASLDLENHETSTQTKPHSDASGGPKNE